MTTDTGAFVRGEPEDSNADISRIMISWETTPSPSEVQIHFVGRETATTQSPIDPYVRARFEVLAEWWRTDTVDMASPRERFQHPAYQHIIAMGQPTVPYILEELRENGGYWFEALRQITGRSPARLEDRNSYEAVRHAWLEWGATYH